MLRDLEKNAVELGFGEFGGLDRWVTCNSVTNDCAKLRGGGIWIDAGRVVWRCGGGVECEEVVEEDWAVGCERVNQAKRAEAAEVEVGGGRTGNLGAMVWMGI